MFVFYSYMKLVDFVKKIKIKIISLASSSILHVLLTNARRAIHLF